MNGDHAAVRPDVQAIKDEVQAAKNVCNDIRADVAFISRELELRNARITELEAECQRLRGLLAEASDNEVMRSRETDRTMRGETTP